MMVFGIGRGRVIDRRPEGGDGTRSLSRGKNFRSRTTNAELLNLKATKTAMYQEQECEEGEGKKRKNEICYEKT